MALSVHVLRSELDRSIRGLRESISQKGLVATGGRVASVAWGQLTFPAVSARRRDERFDFCGERLPYSFSRYNNSFLNERVVEISVAKWFLSSGTGRVLEVGNVLAHYGISGHTVLDKYETVPGVLNADIVEFEPAEPFDAVLALSTLEHVGWDEEPREPEKVLKAVEALRNFVAPGGRLLVSIPIGYNQRLDEALRSGEVTFPQETWLVRTNQRNEWIEADRDRALTTEYGHPYTGANGLYFGMIAGGPASAA